jgi:O-antigen/teichoic acid export membrane protein
MNKKTQGAPASLLLPKVGRSRHRLRRLHCSVMAESSIRGATSAADHLSTKHLLPALKIRTIRGAIASAGSQGGQLVITVAYNAVLARLISPHDFGLVAMGMVVGGFLHVFKDAGLSTATIQRQDLTNAQVSNLFWINVVVGTTAMVGVAATAPLVAWFFHQPELVGISVALSIGFLLEALAVQHVAILNRQMRFTLLSGIEFGCTAAGFLTGAFMALADWGYWSLVGATLSTSTFRLTTVWGLSRWRPQRPSRRSGTRPLVRFGADLTLVGVVYALSRGTDSLLIGRYIGTDAVGLYSRATALVTRPLERLMAPIYNVIVPALSRLQGQPDRYRGAFLHVFEVLAIMAFFLAGLLFPLANLVIRVILGDKWDAAAPIFAALTFSFISVPLATATSWLCTSQGRGRDLLVTASVGALIMVGAFLAALPFGATGVAIAYSSSSLVAILPVTFYMGGRAGPVTARDLWIAVISHVPVFAVVLAATSVARQWMGHTAAAPLLSLIVCLAVGTTAALAALWGFPRSRRTIRALLVQLKELGTNHAETREVEVGT